MPNKSRPPLHIYIARLTAFTLVVSLVAYLGLNAGMAWLYISVFTQPGCIQTPPVLEVMPPHQEIQLLTEDGLRLRFWYYPPQNGAVVLSLGGTGGSLGAMAPEVGFLIRQGYGVLQIDSRACAQPPGRVTLGAKEALAAKAGLDFILEQPETLHVGAIGFSMGGATAIRAAARYAEIEAVVAEGGFFNLGKDMVEPGVPKPFPQTLLFYTIAGFYWLQTGANPWQISPVDDLPKISPRPVLLIYGEHELDDGRALVQYAAAQEPKELWIVPGGGHGRNHLVASQEYERRVSDFFKQALLNP
jgi:pimeloyl-ACP methyl ester carboxylesterase